MTNAQAALQAAATSLADGTWRESEAILFRAEKFKAWLDEQDKKDADKMRIRIDRTYGEI